MPQNTMNPFPPGTNRGCSTPNEDCCSTCNPCDVYGKLEGAIAGLVQAVKLRSLTPKERKKYLERDDF